MNQNQPLLQEELLEKSVKEDMKYFKNCTLPKTIKHLQKSEALKMLINRKKIVMTFADESKETILCWIEDAQ